MGVVDAVIEADLKPYDIQALIPIVEGAGGVITDWSGRDAQHGGAVVACGDRRCSRRLSVQGHRAHDTCATLDLEFNGQTVPAPQIHATAMAALAFAYASIESTISVADSFGE